MTSDPIDNALVDLISGDDRFTLDFNELTGLYENGDGSLDILSGNLYQLEVTVGERTATAETLVPAYPQGWFYRILF